MIDEKWIAEFSEKHCYNKEKYGNNNPKLVILGETHDPFKECPEQVELIETLKPEYALIETLHAVTYDPERDCIEFREDVTCLDEYDLGALRTFKNYPSCYKKISKNKNKVKLVGCDLSHQEEENERNRLGFIDFGFSESCSEEELLCRQLNGIRELKMGEIIISYSKKTSKPLVAIIGHRHADKSSKIHSVLEGKVDYIVIWDC